jgi:hypothetical protein
MPRKASLVQVRAGSGGRMVEIDQDVFDVCARIREIDPRLGVDFSEAAGAFRIYEIGEDGKRRAVFWTRELTADIPGYLQELDKTDYVKAIDAVDAKAERDADHAFAEKVGPPSEKLKHAVRKDIGYKGTAFIPRSI